MTTTRLRFLALLAGAVLSGLSVTDALAVERYGLRLGRPRALENGTLAVPVQLRTPKDVEVAALNFTLSWDAAALDLAPRGVVAGATVRRANAELASRADAAAGTLRVIVVPEFRAGFASLQGKRLATVYLKPRGRMPHKVRRWVEQHIVLHDVVLGDPEGRELHLRSAARTR